MFIKQVRGKTVHKREMYEKACLHWKITHPLYPHLIFLQVAAKTDPPVAATPAFPAAPNPITPADCRVATTPPATTPPPLATAITDISQEPKLAAAMPAVVKPAAAMAKGAAATAATAPPAAMAAISAAVPVVKYYVFKIFKIYLYIYIFKIFKSTEYIHTYIT